MFRCRKTLSTEKHNLTFSVNYEVIGKGISDLEVCKHRIHKNLRVLWFQVCHLPSLMLFPLTYSRPFIKHLHRSEFNGEENLENESNTNYTLHCCGYHSKSSFPTLPSAQGSKVTEEELLTLCLRNMLSAQRQTRELLSFERKMSFPEKVQREEAPVWVCFFLIICFLLCTFLPLLRCLSYSNNLLTSFFPVRFWILELFYIYQIHTKTWA